MDFLMESGFMHWMSERMSFTNWVKADFHETSRITLRFSAPPRDAFAVELPIFSFGYKCDEPSWPEDYSSLEIHLRGICTSPLSCDARLGKMYPRFLGAFVSAIKEKREKWPMK